MKQWHFYIHGKKLPKVLLLFCICDSVIGCYNSGWGFFDEDLLSDLCPSLAAISEKVKEFFNLDDSQQKSKVIVADDNNFVSSDVVSECLKCGREWSRAAAKRGSELVKNGHNMECYSPAMLHFFSPKLPGDVRESATTSHEMLCATKLLQMKLTSRSNVTPNTFLSFLENQVIRLNDAKYCKPASTIICTDKRYRTIDGTCNNQQHATWGRKGAPFTRIATPRYADGIYSMPLSRSGRLLPNTRVLSTRLFADRPVSSRVLTHLNMQWGQFVTHDMVFQVMEVTDEGGIQCCVGNGEEVLRKEYQNDKCIPICVPEDDHFYSHYGIKCLNFVRSVTTPRDDCSLGYAEQMNTVTAYLDGSPIYGSEKKLARKLRRNVDGKLREVKREYSQKGFLPTVDDKSAVCDLRNLSEPCYLAGDSRINQSPTLAVIHTLLLREHNRVAGVLSKMNPLWGDERVYQEARRIVIAELQHITYQEWLPLNFGDKYFRYYRISPSTLFTRDYDEDVNAGVINAFGASAFRFLHTLISDTFMSCPASYDKAYLYKLSDYYFNPSLLESTPESFDNLVRGTIGHRAGEADPFITTEITNLLFKSHNRWGLDLIAMDIQRGRDHGIASYNNYRELCGLRRANSFQDLIGEISQDRINALAQLYESVDDIDLFVGGALEHDVQGSILGQTFQCIVAEQFYRTRIGDRFFYDNGEMFHSFTPDQLKEIKKASMARLICDNTEGVKFVQRKTFEQESQYNPKYSCVDYNAIPYVDLTAWKKSSDLFD